MRRPAIAAAWWPAAEIKHNSYKTDRDRCWVVIGDIIRLSQREVKHTEINQIGFMVMWWSFVKGIKSC
jgi:hypothetical protein